MTVSTKTEHYGSIKDFMAVCVYWNTLDCTGAHNKVEEVYDYHCISL